MQEIKRYQVRGVPGEVVRALFGDRTVDYWLPKQGTDRVLIAHDGQNVFDGKTSTHRGQTWRIAQTATHVSQDLGLNPPAIIAVWHSSTKHNPWGRAMDLAPQQFFSKGEYIDPRWRLADSQLQLNSDQYLELIFNDILPAIAPFAQSEKTAMIGSSMGGLATLYAAIKHTDKFKTALALSPHWVLSNENFASSMVSALPENHKIWMSRGTRGLDAEYAQIQTLVDGLMRKAGWGSNFRSKIFLKSGHSERYWAKNLHEVLRFWLTPEV